MTPEIKFIREVLSQLLVKTIIKDKNLIGSFRRLNYLNNAFGSDYRSMLSARSISKNFKFYYTSRIVQRYPNTNS